MRTTTSELVAESLGAIEQDVNDLVFARFFERSQAAGRLMRYTDQYMRGRMLEQVYQLMLGEEDFEAWLDFELGNHRDYGVEDGMYGDLFIALHDVVRKHTNTPWRPEWEDAWQTRTGELIAFIGAHVRPALAVGN